MLAYRHAFHAGNHADVLKHLVLCQVLRYFADKGKPLRYVDTHAGAGAYRLNAAPAQKNAEFREGIGRLWGAKGLSPALADYVEQVRALNTPPGPARPGAAWPALRTYPGSPLLAQRLLPPGTGLRLFELHPTDARALAAQFEGQRAVQVLHQDGFDGLKGQLPPTPRRAVVLMDPSYEVAADYGRTVAALREGLRRFAEGTFIVWYPQVNRLEAAQLPKRLTALAPKGWLHAHMTVARPDAQGFGLVGSGVVVINPPYTLEGVLRAELPGLVQRLGQFEGAVSGVEAGGA